MLFHDIMVILTSSKAGRDVATEHFTLWQCVVCWHRNLCVPSMISTAKSALA